MNSYDINLEKVPTHIAIIMDGNGRWAKSRFLPRTAGHKAGVEAIREVIKESQRLGVKHLTLYAFSTENWKRSIAEVSGIFKLLVTYVNSELKELVENNVKVTVLGDYRQIPSDAEKSLEKTLEATKNNTGLRFNIALNYGGRHEIVHAVQQAVSLARQGTLTPEAVDEALVDSLMYTAGQPPVDLIIRPSGEQRISNFLLWQGAYAEFVFMDVLWPDFTPGDLDRAIAEFQRRSRRFGGISS